jgi:sphinganine-1-phosphate aldolase
MPPLAVVVRRARPIVTYLGLTLWILFRLSPLQDNDTTLLHLWVDLVAAARTKVISHLGGYGHASTSWVCSTLLIPVTEWLFSVAQDIMAILLVTGLFRLTYCLYHYSAKEWYDAAVDSLFEWASHNVSAVQKEMAKQTASFNADAETMLHKNPDRVKTLGIPETGRDRELVLRELQNNAATENSVWQEGTVSGTVYSDDPEHTTFLNAVYSAYSWSNPLHPGQWPKLNQCESEVIAMTSDLLHGPGIGCMSSGGTESILLAVRAHLNVYGKQRGIVHPEIVCGSTAHAALNKACEVFGIRQVVIDCDDGRTYQLKSEAVRKHITANTIMIYASAPTYPQGVIDPISELSDIAVEYDIGLHVDACLGGFVLPFCDDVPAFDFRCPGVTSMSADTHKYGFSTKGTSVVMYNKNELRHGQYFAYAKWTGGMYVTPTFAGSRPGALSACAWAALVSVGRVGYRERVDQIVKAARSFAAGVEKIDGLKLLTAKPYMVVCVGSDEMDIYRVKDALTTAGWSLSSLQSPACIHICVTLNSAPNMERLLQDLREAVAKVRSEGDKGSKNGTAGVYGTVGSIPGGPGTLGIGRHSLGLVLHRLSRSTCSSPPCFFLLCTVSKVQHILRAFADATLTP